MCYIIHDSIRIANEMALIHQNQLMERDLNLNLTGIINI